MKLALCCLAATMPAAGIVPGNQPAFTSALLSATDWNAGMFLSVIQMSTQTKVGQLRSASHVLPQQRRWTPALTQRD